MLQNIKQSIWHHKIFFSLFHVKKRTITYEGKRSSSVVFSTKKGLLKVQTRAEQRSCNSFLQTASHSSVTNFLNFQVGIDLIIRCHYNFAAVVFSFILFPGCIKGWFYFPATVGAEKISRKFKESEHPDQSEPNEKRLLGQISTHNICIVISRTSTPTSLGNVSLYKLQNTQTLKDNVKVSNAWKKI